MMMRLFLGVAVVLLLSLIAPSEAVRSLRASAKHAQAQNQELTAASTAASSKKKTGLGRFARATAKRVHQRAQSELDFREAPPSERRYWSLMWQSMETELIQVGEVLGKPIQKVQATCASSLVLTSARRNPVKEAPKNATTEESRSPAPHSKSPEPEAAFAPGKVGVKALEPMLGMLKQVYEDAKTRIGKLNQDEKKSKADFAEKEKAHKQRVAHIEAAHENRTKHTTKAYLHAEANFTDELFKNETKWEDRIFSYRTRCRDRHHKQYHNMLKMTHASMEKEGQMIKAYGAAIAAASKKEDTNLANAAMKKVKEVIRTEDMPEVVLLQGQKQATLGFVEDSLQEVRRQLRALF